MVHPFHEDSKYVLGFEIGQRKVVCIANEQTESQTDRIMPTSSTVLLRVSEANEVRTKSYMGRPVDIQLALKPLKKSRKNVR